MRRRKGKGKEKGGRRYLDKLKEKGNMEGDFYCWNLSKKSEIEGPDLLPWVGAGGAFCVDFDDDETPDEDDEEVVEVCDFEVL